MVLNMLLLLLCVNSLHSADSTSELRMVHLLYRHGDRTPYQFYPTDPYRNMSEWSDGIGQLTNRGKKMCFELGKWIRSYYEGFLSEDYNHDEIFVRSSDVDRTIMSAEAVLAGLYPPYGEDIWAADLAWQPVPVHTVPKEYDLLFAEHQPCPRIDQLDRQVRESEYMRDIVYSSNKDLFHYISQHSGCNITSVEQLCAVYDALAVETIHSKTLPAWTQDVFPGGKFDQLRKLSFVHDTFNDELKKLKAGPFLNELISHFSDLASGDTRSSSLKKMYMYSAHDISLTRVLTTLGVYNDHPPPYASMLIFSLLDQDGWKVSISYRNDTTSQPHSLTLPGCQQLCPLEKFEEITREFRPLKWGEECKIRGG